MIKLFFYIAPRLFLVVLLAFSLPALSQQKGDTLSKEVPVSKINKIADTLKGQKVDSVVAVHSPHKAIVRSAIIPGWGQIYNKKYWKVPLVYAALGTSAGVFFHNLKFYKDSRFAYKAQYEASLPPYDPANPRPGPYRDSTDYFKINPKLLGYGLEDLRYNRDEFRRYVDYSALIFVFLWGLNVVDAAVDAHLKAFDVSPDLSLKFRAGHSEMANTNGISLVLAIK